MNFGHWCDVLAQKKVGVRGFEIFFYSRMDDTDAFKLKGGIPEIRKGKKTWPKPHKTVIVTTREIRAEARLYEQATGHCSDCLGGGKTLASAHADGTRTYRECERCAGSGWILAVGPACDDCLLEFKTEAELLDHEREQHADRFNENGGRIVTQAELEHQGQQRLVGVT